MLSVIGPPSSVLRRRVAKKGREVGLQPILAMRQPSLVGRYAHRLGADRRCAQAECGLAARIARVQFPDDQGSNLRPRKTMCP
jgi:hypothetical protein